MAQELTQYAVMILQKKNLKKEYIMYIYKWIT